MPMRQERQVKLATAGCVPASQDPFSALLGFLSLAILAPGHLGQCLCWTCPITICLYVYVGRKPIWKASFQLTHSDSMSPCQEINPGSATQAQPEQLSLIPQVRDLK